LEYTGGYAIAPPTLGDDTNMISSQYHHDTDMIQMLSYVP